MATGDRERGGEYCHPKQYSPAYAQPNHLLPKEKKCVYGLVTRVGRGYIQSKMRQMTVTGSCKTQQGGVQCLLQLQQDECEGEDEGEANKRIANPRCEEMRETTRPVRCTAKGRQMKDAFAP